MKKLNISVLLFALAALFSGCTFIGNIFTYKNTSQEFVSELLSNNYDKCLNLMDLNNPIIKSIDRDTLKKSCENLRKIIVDNFGDQADITFMQTEKKWSYGEKDENTIPNSTKVLMQVSNRKEFGILTFIFDNHSKKILAVNINNAKYPVPDQTIFWLFGCLALCIPIFNIYMIIRVKRSRLKTKWVKYLMILILNVPAISYQLLGGLSFALLSFQILLGVSFNYMGYISSSWTFGIPLGGLWVLWMIKNQKNKRDLMPESELPEDEESGQQDPDKLEQVSE